MSVLWNKLYKIKWKPLAAYLNHKSNTKYEEEIKKYKMKTSISMSSAAVASFIIRIRNVNVIKGNRQNVDNFLGF